MSVYSAETFDYSSSADVVISLAGSLPESGMCIHIPQRALSCCINLSVKVASTLYTLCCNWEKIKLNCSVSFKKAKKAVSRVFRSLSGSAPMKPAAILTASYVRLRL